MKPAWTLFLDRDGVINKRNVGGYITKWADFEFEKGALSFISSVKSFFETIVVVTNQQGVAKGVMRQSDLDEIHTNMIHKIREVGGEIHQVFSCTCLASDPDNCRKPSGDMAQQAKEIYPSIDFKQSIMIGDSVTDMQFGHRLGMKTLFIHNQSDTMEKDLKWIHSNCWFVASDMLQALDQITKWYANVS